MERKKVYLKSTFSDELYSWIYRILPDEICSFVKGADNTRLSDISEIRLRACGVSCVTVGTNNIIITKPYSVLPVRLTEKDIEDFIYKLCHGSVYSYEKEISHGYITVDGVRIGISGDVIIQNNCIVGFSKIKSVNIRLPRHIDGCADELLKMISVGAFGKNYGLLIASAPGVGKTTVLRELAVKLSHSDCKDSPFRVSVIDERCELYIPQLFVDCCADIYCGIPKHKGIEFASRTMNPEIIIFDELGSESDAASVISAHFGGVCFISSVHASSPDAVCEKKVIRNLADEGIFTHIYFLERTPSGIKGTVHPIKKC